MVIYSHSVGNPERFLPLVELESRLKTMPGAPKDTGRVGLVLRRGDMGEREILDRIRVSPELGIPGDAWERNPKRKLDAQIAVMQLNLASLLANGQPLTLFGDELFLDLDLSRSNLPPGSRVRINDAVLAITAEPHDGCKKFQSRVGKDAHQLVWKTDWRRLNLRGIYMRVVEPGEIGQGDVVRVIHRGSTGREGG